MAIRCPICESGEYAQKVSAAYDSGRSTGMYGGPVTSVSFSNNKTSTGWSAGTIRSSLELAMKVAPPDRPNNFFVP
jgi:hypothetical protein